MTDLSQPAPVFEIHFRTETFETELFGPVTIRELPTRQLKTLFEQYPPEENSEAFGLNLLCASASGPNGERFTVEVLENIPMRALDDMATLLRMTVKLNGVSKEEVEKA